ncbi:MAG TPA: glycosyltransferase family 10 [Mucilaginibacter sp.]
MSKQLIKLRFQNGLSFETFKKEVFDVAGLNNDYIFEESSNPDFIIFGPYGNDTPAKGDYTRIGYFCENIKPDLSICEWAFGVPLEQDVKHPKYKRIQWHGLDPQNLVKGTDFNAEKILASKTKFCNFLYSHKVHYREEFVEQLTKYKKVDAPGKSMNNMNSIDSLFKGDIWERKKQFLSPYKFTIAFENYVYPGYQTEKLYDAMQVNSIPIYCGDPFIGNIFNTSSFVNVPDYIKINNSVLVRRLEQNSQLDFIDILPQFYHNPVHRIKRKLKDIGKHAKMKLQFLKFDFKPLIDRIIELDEDDNKYLEVLRQPWFIENKEPLNVSLKNRWIEIFQSGKNKSISAR